MSDEPKKRGRNAQVLCFLAAAIALLVDYYGEQRFKDGLFQFMTAFTLPWYAIVGVQAAIGAKLGYLAAVIIGCIATSAGRWLIDTACNVIPKQLVRGEFFMLSAALTGIAYCVCDSLGMPIPASTAIAFFVGFSFRLTSQTLGWEEWEPWEPDPLKEGEKKRKKLGEGLHAQFHPEETK